MSRYTYTIPSNTWAWGFDEALNEFFFQKFDNYPFDLYDEENPDDTIFSVSNRFTTKEHPDFPGKTDWSNLELVKLMTSEMEEHEFEIPVEHIAAIRSDRPF